MSSAIVVVAITLIIVGIIFQVGIQALGDVEKPFEDTELEGSYYISLDGNDDYGDILRDSIEYQELTMASWIKMDGATGEDGINEQIISNNQCGVNNGFEWKVDVVNNQSGFEYAWNYTGQPLGDTFYQTNTIIDTVYPTNTWKHVAIATKTTVQNTQLIFDPANSQHVRIENAANLNFTNAMAISAFITPTSDTDDFRSIVRKEGAYVLEKSSDDKVRGTFWTDGSIPSFVQSSTSLVPNTTVHAVFSYNSTHMQLWIDKNLEATVARNGTIDKNWNPLYFASNGGGSAFAPIRLDSVALYNQGLTQSQVNDLYDGKLVSSGLVARYDFNEGYGRYLNDLAGYDNNGLLSSNRPTWEVSTIGNATTIRIIDWYIDGVLIDTIGNPRYLIDYTNVDNARIGMLTENINCPDLNHYQSHHFGGDMDDLVVYKVYKTQSEIQAIKAGTITKDGNLVAYWDFNQGSGMIAEDDSNNNNDITLQNGTAWIDEDPILNAQVDNRKDINDEFDDISDSIWLTMRISSLCMVAVGIIMIFGRDKIGI